MEESTRGYGTEGGKRKTRSGSERKGLPFGQLAESSEEREVRKQAQKNRNRGRQVETEGRSESERKLQAALAA
ncbi:hypothetical protein ACFXTH_046874 [Malus domestica]